MAITLEQAKNLGTGDQLHYVGENSRARSNACEVVTGPRGGVTEKVIRIRISGKPNTLKRTPNFVKVPFKYGMYEHGYITEDNLSDFHMASECPAGIR